jgi:hypothetical protein
MIKRQRGVATLIALIALVVMLVAGIALVRSSGITELAAGNVGFRRDLTNQAEVAMKTVNALFSTIGGVTGALSNPALRTANQIAYNYSATEIPDAAVYSTSVSSNTAFAGIPVALTDSTTFSTYGTTTNDIDITNPSTASCGSINPETSNDVCVRYVIDRMCIPGTVDPTPANCALGLNETQSSTTAQYGALPGPGYPTYRVSVRVTGPHNTITFVQATFYK